MSHWFSSQSFLTFTALLATLLSPAMGQSPDSDPEGKNSKCQLRFICGSSLAEDQEVVLASRDAEGKLIELGVVELRSSLITDWMPATAGELHLALREDAALKSICHFQYPADTQRVLVALIANTEKNMYESNVVDPEKTGFVKGSVLIINFSPHTSYVLLGSKEEKVEAGQQWVVKPVADENGMSRIVVSTPDADGKSVPCYDKYVSRNPNSRSMMFLLPDKTHGLKVFSLPIFGELD